MFRILVIIALTITQSAFAQVTAKCSASSFKGFWEIKDGQNAGAIVEIAAAIPGHHHEKEIGTIDTDNQIYFNWRNPTGPVDVTPALREHRLDVKRSSQGVGCTLSYEYSPYLLNHYGNKGVHPVGEIAYDKTKDVINLKTKGINSVLTRKSSSNYWRPGMRVEFKAKYQTKDGLQWNGIVDRALLDYSSPVLYTADFSAEEAKTLCETLGMRLPNGDELAQLFTELGYSKRIVTDSSFTPPQIAVWKINKPISAGFDEGIEEYKYRIQAFEDSFLRKFKYWVAYSNTDSTAVTLYAGLLGGTWNDSGYKYLTIVTGNAFRPRDRNVMCVK